MKVTLDVLMILFANLLAMNTFSTAMFVWSSFVHRSLSKTDFAARSGSVYRSFRANLV